MLPPDIPGQQFNFYPRGGTIFDNRVTTIKVDHNFNPQHKLSFTTTLQTRPGDYSGQGWGSISRSMEVRIPRTFNRSMPE